MAITKAKLIADGVITVDNLNASHGITTTHIGEGEKLFYTDARVSSYLTSNNYTTSAGGYFYDASLSANILTFSKSDGTTDSVDLSLYLDDTNLARLVSGTLDGLTGIATFTRDDSSTFTIDFSAFLADANDYVSSGSFNTSTGVLTLTRLGGGTVTVDLDGKYAEASHTHLWSHITDRPTALSAFTNDLGNYGGFVEVESDPTVPSHVKSITTTNITNWNTAYGWGNHAGLYSLLGHTHDYLPIGGKAADSELLDGVDSSRVIYGSNSTGTSYISGATLGTALKSGFYTTDGGVPNASAVNFVLHTAYYGEGNLAGFDLACNDSTSSSFYLRPATGGGKGAWQTIITSSNIGSQSVNYATSAGNASTLGGYAPNQTGGANTIVQRDANGYIQNSYFYTSGGGSERNGSGMGYVAGFNSSDYYIRSYTMQGLASAMSGVTMNINGSATTSSTTTHYASRTDSSWYNAVWAAGNPSHLYSADSVQIQSSTGSIKANVFYDNNNTGYYVDPASTSNLAGLTVANQISGSVSGGSNYVVSTGYGNGTFTWRQSSTTFGPYSGWHNYLISNHGDGSSYYNTIIAMPFWGTPRYSRLESGTQRGPYEFWVSEGAINSQYDIQAPIFYDYNDTGYYLNPQGFSNLGRIKFNDVVSSGAPVGDAVVGRNYAYNTLELKGYGAEMMIGSQSTDLHINYRYCNNTGNNSYTPQYWYWRNGTSSGWSDHYWGIGYGTYSLRSPIFYDSNNTAHYIDPSAGSNIRNLYVGDTGSSWSDPGGWGTQFHVSNGPHSIIRVYARNESIQTGMYSHVGGLSKAGSLSNHDFRIIRNDSDRMYFYSGYTYSNGYLEAADSLRAPIFYDSNDTGYYVDPNGTSRLNSINTNDGNIELYKEQTIDLSGAAYSTSNYYPVIIGVPTSGVWIQIQNNLNSNTPSWATHGSGFTLNLRWWVNGNGWGTTEVNRRVTQYHERFTNSRICGGITQMGTSSQEVVYLRGGGVYYFRYSRNISGFASSTNYSNPYNVESANVTSSPINDVWNSKVGYQQVWADAIRATSDFHTPIIYDYNDTGYYLDPNSSGTCFRGAGSVNVNGDVTAYYSDMRLKTKIADIKNPIEKVKSLSGFIYEPNEIAQSYGYKKEQKVGVSAQEVQAVLPEAVKDAPIGNGYLTVQYDKLVPLLIEAIKEQQKQIEELKAIVNGITK